MRIGKSKTLIQKQHTLKEFNALFLVKERFVICVSFSVLEIEQKLHIILFTYMKVFQSILPDPFMTIKVGVFFQTVILIKFKQVRRNAHYIIMWKV